jgi:hypothetical protein
VKDAPAKGNAQFDGQGTPKSGPPASPGLHNFNPPWSRDVERDDNDYLTTRRQEMNNDGGSSFPLETPPPAVKYTSSLKNTETLQWSIAP